MDGSHDHAGYATADHAHAERGTDPRELFPNVYDIREAYANDLLLAAERLPDHTLLLIGGDYEVRGVSVNFPQRHIGILGTGANPSELTETNLQPSRTDIVVAGASRGLVFNPDARDTRFDGPDLRNFRIRGDLNQHQTGQGGIWIKRSNNFTLDTIVATNFVGPDGTGIDVDATGPRLWCQYGTLHNVRSHRNRTGVRLFNTSGLQISNLHLDGAENNNGTPKLPGSIGILQDGFMGESSTVKAANVIVQGYETLLDLRVFDRDSWTNLRLEAWGPGYKNAPPVSVPSAVKLGKGYGASFIGVSCANNLGGSRGYGFDAGRAQAPYGPWLATVIGASGGGMTAMFNDPSNMIRKVAS